MCCFDLLSTSPYIDSKHSGSVNYQYDQNGNMTEDKSKNMTVVYDWRDMPASFDFKNESEEWVSTVEMVYDASGNRVIKSVKTITEAKAVAYIDNNMVYENENTENEDFQLQYTNIITPAGTEGKTDYSSGSNYFYLKDHLGSTRSVIDNEGSCIEAVMYDSYGKLYTLFISEVPVREKFTGKELDEGVPGFIILDLDINVTDLEENDEVTFTISEVSNTFFAKWIDNIEGSAVSNQEIQILGDKNVSSVAIGLKRFDPSLGDYNTKIIIQTLDPSVQVSNGEKISISFNESADDIWNENIYEDFIIDVEETQYSTGGMQLIYFGARCYDPDIGGFISTDPMDEFWNPFSYCGGNPIRFIDPFGLDIWEATGGEFQMMDEMLAAKFDWSAYAEMKGDYTISQIFSGGFQDFLGQQALNNFINIAIYTNPDFGIGMMKEFTGTSANVLSFVPQLRYPALGVHAVFAVADWNLTAARTGKWPTGTMAKDLSSMVLGAAINNPGGAIASEGFSQTSKVIPSKKRP